MTRSTPFLTSTCSQPLDDSTAPPVPSRPPVYGCRYDPYIGAMTDMYNALSGAKRGPIKMVLGPWTHGDHGKVRHTSDLDLDPH